MKNIEWHDISPEKLFGRGWRITTPRFGRLPAHAERLLPDTVWNMRVNSTGTYTEFLTDSTEIHVQWELGENKLGEANFSVCAHSGVDLYCRSGRTWRWVSMANASGRDNTAELLPGLAKKKRHFRLYLPLRNSVKSIAVGADKACSFSWGTPDRTMPAVYYGSSIIHGSYVSRAGLGITSRLSRELNIPVINLGFSGAAKMEQGMAALMSELDSFLFLIDPLPNMNEELVVERMEPFLRTLCSAKPDTPIVFITDPDRSGAWIYPEKTAAHRNKRKTAAAILRRLQKEFQNLYLIDAQEFMREDHEGTVDGIHPNDLGAEQFAAFLARSLHDRIFKNHNGK